MTVRIETAARNAGLDATFDLIDTGGAGSVRIYSGGQPATANTAATGTLLVTLVLNTPGFTPAAAGAKGLNLSTGISANAVASGTAGWARVVNGAGATVFDGSVGTSGADFTINTVSIINGQSVVLLGGTITDPA